MNQSPRSAGSLIRKIVAVIILVPLAIVFIGFAVANRQDVTVSLDPFNFAHPAYSRTMRLFEPIFAALILGVVIGGLASWLRHGGWRRTALRLEREAATLRSEIASLRHRNEPPAAPAPAERLERPKLGAPVR